MRLSPLLSRFIALFLAILVVAAGVVGLVVPLAEAFLGKAAAIDDTRNLLERYERAAAARPALEQELATLDRQPIDTGFYLTGANEALSAAALQGNVSSLISSHGANLGSIQTLPAQPDKGLRRVAIRVQMNTTNDVALQVLHALEAGKPLLFIDNLTIARRDAATSASVIPVLSIAFDLYGYLPAAAQGVMP
ncbi:MAG: type II secretion system protein GspM [Bradyrhizobium sp.]